MRKLPGGPTLDQVHAAAVADTDMLRWASPLLSDGQLVPAAPPDLDQHALVAGATPDQLDTSTTDGRTALLHSPNINNAIGKRRAEAGEAATQEARAAAFVRALARGQVYYGANAHVVPAWARVNAEGEPDPAGEFTTAEGSTFLLATATRGNGIDASWWRAVEAAMADSDELVGAALTVLALGNTEALISFFLLRFPSLREP